VLNCRVPETLGYLGSVLVPVLLHAGHRVSVVDNFLFRQNSLAAVCADPNFNVVRGDARDPDVLRPLVRDADVVIPLAALVGAPACDLDKVGAQTTNFEAINTLLRLLSNDQRVIMPITNSGYGVGDGDKLCTEESPMRPVSLYGRTKVDAEKLATVFGMSPRMRIDLLVNEFVYRALMDRTVVLFEGHFKRNYIHVRDVAHTFVHGLREFREMRDQAYNVGLSDANLSKIELCDRIRQQLPNFVFLEADIGDDPDKRNYMVSNTKIEKTGWRPTYGLDDGIKELIKGYRMLRNTRYGNV